MKRTPTRLALGAALSAVLAVGAVAPAYAAPQHTVAAGAVKPDSDKAGKEKPGKAKPDKATKKLVKKKQQVAKRIAKTTRDLTGVASRFTEVSVAAEVNANIDVDITRLAQLKDALELATTAAEVKTIDTAVRAHRVEVYKQLASAVQHADRVAADVAEALTAHAALVEAAGGDARSSRRSPRRRRRSPLRRRLSRPLSRRP